MFVSATSNYNDISTELFEDRDSLRNSTMAVVESLVEGELSWLVIIFGEDWRRIFTSAWTSNTNLRWKLQILFIHIEEDKFGVV